LFVRYYSKIPFNPKSWQLRWATVDSKGFRTSRQRGLKPGTKAVDMYQATSVDVVDKDRYIFTVRSKTGNTLLQAPSEQIMIQILRILNKYLVEYQKLPAGSKASLYRSSLLDPFSVPTCQVHTRAHGRQRRRGDAAAGNAASTQHRAPC